MENPVHSPNDPLLAASDRFPERHIGPRPEDVEGMLGELGIDSLEALVEEVIPAPVRRKDTLALRGLPDPAWSESEAALKLRALASRNQVLRSCIGMGYSECIVPPVIQRNVLENPGWYTAYTPYQAEISQGRLEALLNFQTMIADLTALPLANASLLDEATSSTRPPPRRRAQREQLMVVPTTATAEMDGNDGNNDGWLARTALSSSCD